jgi:isopentenyl diphosphate isomerase/L-lactate dehydrogenase-like FMN-dependent dehydrogenase
MQMEEIRSAAAEGQIIFNQLYLTNNDTDTQRQFDRAKAAGAKAIVWTIDSPGSPTRQRAARFGVGSA